MTPPEESIPSLPFTLESSMSLLGWDLVRRSLSAHALSDVTRARCFALIPETSFESAITLLKETEAMRILLDTAEGLPLRTFADIDPTLQEAEQHRMIDPGQGLAVLDLLRLTESIRKRLKNETTPDILKIFGTRLNPMPGLLSELDRCLDPEDGVRDSASPELKAAIKDAAQTKQQLETQVKKIMGSAAWKDSLQDGYITEREGRAVLPIRSDSKGRVEGIVHDSSGSGQTLFIEPTQVVQLNNQLKIARMNVERERVRILAQLAERILEEKEPLLRNLENLADLDLIHARANLARAMKAGPFELSQSGEVELRHARNPELLLSGKNVVPNSLQWNPDIRVVIISGPNTGGKTVTLKTLGLMSLMARAGLLLPVDEGSRIPFFPQVYADIGDEQDMSQDLSTFSGHLKKITHILDEAETGALILLDELGIATDPLQGAALAQAILMQMKDRRLMTLVSTHYLSLKVYAQTAEGFTNACMEFDLNSMTPTFRLVFGAPGQSAALETAERLGLDPEIIRKSRELYDREDHRAEVLLDELTLQKQNLEYQLKELEDQKEQTRQALQEQNQIRARLRKQEVDFKREKNQKLQAQLRDSKKEIRKLIEEARGTKSVKQLRGTEKRLQAMGRAAGNIPSERRALYTIPASKLKKGDEVIVDGYDAIGILEEDPISKSKVQVRLGNFFTTVEVKRLFGHTQGHRTRPRESETPQVSIQTETHQAPKTTCDLRGKTVEEALQELELFLSQAVVNKCPRVRLIHGHGMGKVKELVRDYLGSTGIGKKFEPASREEGGDGVTIVEF
ncbi:MAG: endonuclease MutS2 [Candidatus Nitronauta litoralis]|uniref:Endonuclease MutS2 n=1 Tax=Candidatus Nitronauta litoralis TaxID=2705533 RepID=A0A7T0FZB4_9BACT|nr:MAG: endonuclease MutS2 [Candidatus Nitronauta litoralis]